MIAHRMLRLLALVLLVAGCSSTGSSVSSQPEPRVTLSEDGKSIEVVIYDPDPVQTVRLFSPTGEVTAAENVKTERTAVQQLNPGSIAGSGLGIGGVGLGQPQRPKISGNGTFGGAGAGGTSGGGGSPLRPGIALSRVSTAAIPIADADDYRANWSSYFIEVELGEPPAQHKLTLKAPQPR
jgi:hypothetical protein